MPGEASDGFVLLNFLGNIVMRTGNKLPLLRDSECIMMDDASDFTPFLTVFQSYQDDGRMIMKFYVQWNPIYD